MPCAALACHPRSSVGRLYAEPESGLRTCWQRDRDRIVHSTAFRRLEYKTQVFVNFEGDHFRTRLTHSLEVAQIARTVARALDLNEDLTEAIALAHDLGHPPFGHAGEEALNDALAPYGGFDHNLQTFRILTRLERRYGDFEGLNLTAETLEGVIKHNGPISGDIPAPIADHPLVEQFHLHLQAPLEAQVAAICDDIAYCSHDVDDGLRARFFTLEELDGLTLLTPIVREVLGRYRDRSPECLAHETVRRLIDRLVGDLLDETRRRIASAKVASLEDVRAAGAPLVGFSAMGASGIRELRDFLHARVYRHYKVNRMARKAGRLVSELCQAFLEAPQCLPDGWRERAGAAGDAQTAAVVRDYVAGMTDRFALAEHERMFTMSRYPT
jgi:dGTPase